MKWSEKAGNWIVAALMAVLALLVGLGAVFFKNDREAVRMLLTLAYSCLGVIKCWCYILV